MKKLISLIIAMALCAGCALCEAPSEWDWIPFDTVLERGIIDQDTMDKITVFIAGEQEMFESGAWEEPSKEMSDLLYNVLMDNVERGCSDKAYLAKLCVWELAVVEIITVDQMYQINEVIEEFNPASVTADTPDDLTVIK